MSTLWPRRKRADLAGFRFQSVQSRCRCGQLQISVRTAPSSQACPPCSRGTASARSHSMSACPPPVTKSLHPDGPRRTTSYAFCAAPSLFIACTHRIVYTALYSTCSGASRFGYSSAPSQRSRRAVTTRPCSSTPRRTHCRVQQRARGCTTLVQRPGGGTAHDVPHSVQPAAATCEIRAEHESAPAGRIHE